MRRQGWVMAVTLAVAAAAPACAAPLPGSSLQSPTTAPAAGLDGVTRVRFDHRAGTTDPAPVVVVPRGGTVEMVIGSDTAERVVVSGPDQVRYVTAGGTVTLRFVAVTPASVRIGGSGVELGRLDVR